MTRTFAVLLVSISLLSSAFAQSGKDQISNYKTKQVVALRSDMNYTQVYFRDSINSISCTLHLPSELEIVGLDAKASIDDFDKLSNTIPAFIINNQVYYTKKEIRDFQFLIPTYLASFTLAGNNYLTINLNLISLTSSFRLGSGSLKLDKDNHVIQDYVFDDRKPFGLKELNKLVDKIR